MARGLLTFKGEAPKKKKSKTKQDKPDSSSATDSRSHTLEPSASLSSSAISAAAPVLPPTIRPRPPLCAPSPGTGHVTTSGTVVTGHGTLFEREFAAGDAMVIDAEMRVVTMRLSNTSCGISSAFAKDVSKPTAFSIFKKPRTTVNHSTSAATTLEDDSAQRFGTFASQTNVVYREKTEHGSYRIKSVAAGDATTRSDLLKMRAKKTSDKYC